MKWIEEWKRHIEDSENGNRNLEERRCLNRFLSGGSTNKHYLFLVEAMEGGGWMPKWISRMNIFKVSESISLMEKLQKNMEAFCNAMEKNKLFPKKKFLKVLEISDELCNNQDMRSLQDNPGETEKVIEALKIKTKESKMLYMRRVMKWAWKNRWTVFKISTILFLAYLLWCWFTAGTGCWLASAIFSKVSGAVNWYKGGNQILKIGLKSDIVSKPVGKHGFVVLEKIGKASQPILKYAKKGIEGSIDLSVKSNDLEKFKILKRIKELNDIYTYPLEFSKRAGINSKIKALKKAYDLLNGGGTINNFFLKVLHNFLENHDASKFENTNAWYQYVCENYDVEADNSSCDNEHLKSFANVLFQIKKK